VGAGKVSLKLLRWLKRSYSLSNEGCAVRQSVLAKRKSR
jgi:hypothetical protein